MHVVTELHSICPELSGGSNSKNAIYISIYLVVFLADDAKI